MTHGLGQRLPKNEPIFKCYVCGGYTCDCDMRLGSKDEIAETRAVMLHQGKQLQALWRIVKSQKAEIERLDEIANLLYELIELRTIDK